MIQPRVRGVVASHILRRSVASTAASTTTHNGNGKVSARQEELMALEVGTPYFWYCYVNEGTLCASLTYHIRHSSHACCCCFPYLTEKVLKI